MSRVSIAIFIFFSISLISCNRPKCEKTGMTVLATEGPVPDDFECHEHKMDE